MQWDLGLGGVGLLIVLSLGFGVLAQLMFWKQASHWLWLAAAAVFFVVGVVVSEVWFGWATQEDLQPNIDGLSFDEVLLTFLVGVVILLAVRFLTRARTHGPLAH